MEQWIRATLSAEHLGLAVLPAAFVVGFLASIVSCCAPPVIAGVVGYASGLGEQRTRREVMLVGASFAFGTILSLAVVGLVAGLVGQVASASLGKYWRFAAGLMMVLFGVIALGLLQFGVPKPRLAGRAMARGIGASLIYGLALGGATTACSFACNPLLAMALGAAFLKGTTLLGAGMLAAFALGYSVPLASGLVGIGLGIARLGRSAGRLIPAVRVTGGVVMIIVGFYLLVVG